MVTVIDAENAVLGRLCTKVAERILDGEEIAVVNSEKAIITGKKKRIKDKYLKKRQVGTYRKGPYFPRSSDRIVKKTVRGMIPYQKPDGRAAFKRLKCYIGVPEEFEKEKAEKIKDTEKKPVEYITIKEISKYLGADV
ncbi:MAG: 50S ribosomal protein L13 [Candidatus Thermoplasmatota archaeon]